MHKLTYKSADEVPEAFRAAAKKLPADGGFEIEVDLASRVTEFRNNNISVIKERDTLSERLSAYLGVIPKEGDAPMLPEKFGALLQELQTTSTKVRDGTLKTTEAIETAVAERIAKVADAAKNRETELGQKLTSTIAERDKARAEASALKVKEAVAAVALQDTVGLVPEALPDVLERANKVFVPGPDGTLVPMRNGEIIRGDDGMKPQTVAEWLTDLRKTAGYMFKASKGGGAGGGGGSGNVVFGDMTPDEVAKLTPMQRLDLHNRKVAGDTTRRRR